MGLRGRTVGCVSLVKGMGLTERTDSRLLMIMIVVAWREGVENDDVLDASTSWDRRHLPACQSTHTPPLIIASLIIPTTPTTTTPPLLSRAPHREEDEEPVRAQPEHVLRDVEEPSSKRHGGVGEEEEEVEEGGAEEEEPRDARPGVGARRHL